LYFFKKPKYALRIHREGVGVEGWHHTRFGVILDMADPFCMRANKVGRGELEKIKELELPEVACWNYILAEKRSSSGNRTVERIVPGI
jgi:hypothetical protein